jgi:hypothetical protein
MLMFASFIHTVPFANTAIITVSSRGITTRPPIEETGVRKDRVWQKEKREKERDRDRDRQRASM